MTEPNHIHGEENWKPIPGYDDTYIISSFGRIKRIKSTQGRGSNLELRGSKTRFGYQYTKLSRKGEHRSFMVHRLVWLAFCGPVPSGLEINHKDGNKQNNRLDNLECVTHQANIDHARFVLDAFRGRKTRRSGIPRLDTQGENHRSAKLTEAVVREIRATHDGATKRWGLHIALAEKYGVSASAIKKIAHRATWKHVPG